MQNYSNDSRQWCLKIVKPVYFEIAILTRQQSTLHSLIRKEEGKLMSWSQEEIALKNKKKLYFSLEKTGMNHYQSCEDGKNGTTNEREKNIYM